jgi:hypothetical protein
MRNFLILTLGVILISCDDPDVMAVPDYMTELYSTNEKCAAYDFIRLDFPDSTVLLLDSLESTITFDRNRSAGSHFSQHYSLRIEDKILNKGAGITFFYLDTERALNNTIVPGKYVITENRHSFQNGIDFQYYVDQSKMFIYGKPASGYLEVTGTEGDSFKLRFCGSFDLILGGDNQAFPATPVTGEYCLTMYD